MHQGSAVIYYRSANWDALDSETQNKRRRIIERFRTEHGAKRVSLLQRDHIEKVLANVEQPGTKFHWLKAIRGLMKSAVPAIWKDNPTDGITGIRPRLCEVVRLGPQHVKGGRIRIERAKGGHDVDILVSAELQAAGDAMPKGHLTFIITA